MSELELVRERVVAGLRACEDGGCITCPYYQHDWCRKDLDKEAMAVLTMDLYRRCNGKEPEGDEAVKQAVKELAERAAGNYGPRDTAAEQDTPENVTPVNDPVNHPGHYTTGKIEVIDFITDKGLNFCRGNAVKYIVRAGLKDPEKEAEDLEKAVFYLNREIADVQARKKGAV